MKTLHTAAVIKNLVAVTINDLDYGSLEKVFTMKWRVHFRLLYYLWFSPVDGISCCAIRQLCLPVSCQRVISMRPDLARPQAVTAVNSHTLSHKHTHTHCIQSSCIDAEPLTQHIRLHKCNTLFPREKKLH